MTMRNLLLVIGLTTGLFSTTFANTNPNDGIEGFVQGEVNQADPNVADKGDQGAAGPSEYCEVCARLAAYRLMAKTVGRARANQKYGDPSTWDGEGQR